MKVNIELSFLTELIARNKNYDEICELFKIPDSFRSNSYAGAQIKERINTYLQKAMIAENNLKRENGSAFTPPPPIPMNDVLIDDFPQVNLNSVPIGEIVNEEI